MLLHGKKEAFIHEAKGGARPVEELEREADAFASSTLIPRQFDAELEYLKTDQAIAAFAERLGISPGIVVGRLQHGELVGWKHHNRLKQRFRWVESEAG